MMTNCFPEWLNHLTLPPAIDILKLLDFLALLGVQLYVRTILNCISLIY